MTLEKAAEIFGALGFRVAYVDEGVVKVSIVKPGIFNAKDLGLHNVYFKKATDLNGEHIYAWSGTLDYEDIAFRSFDSDCVPLIEVYRYTIEHNNEMLVGAGLKFRMV